jgi:hypothetical protein
MRKIVAVAGRPGTGKTSLFREFLRGSQWEAVEPKKSLHALYNKSLDIYVLGKYDPSETFAGTDRLGMNIQPTAEEFVRETKSSILFEGDRLTNAKFYDFLLSLPDTEVSIVVLTAAEDTLKKRYSDRGSDQSETFLKGRDTKISNILTNFSYMPYREVFANESLEDQQSILSHIEKQLGVV